MGLARVLILAVQTLALPPLVGLWDFAGIASETPGAGDLVSIFANPSTNSPVVARLDREGILSADGSTRLCRWIRDLDVPAAARGCIFTESDYEIPALAVFAQQGNWLRIALDDKATRFGWVQQRGEFHPLPELIGGEKLTYLAAAWDRTMYDSPGSGVSAPGARPARLSENAARVTREVPYRAIGHLVLQGRLWLHVELLDEVCGAQDPRVVDTGWVPAESAAGVQWAWFWSRGC